MNELISLEKIAQWQKLKTLVLDSVSSPITKRVYNMALDEFMSWFQQVPRAGFTRASRAGSSRGDSGFTPPGPHPSRNRSDSQQPRAPHAPRHRVAAGI